MSRYPMCTDQPAQIDCRSVTCVFHMEGNCTNISPAITLQPIDDGGATFKAICWSCKPKPEKEK